MRCLKIFFLLFLCLTCLTSCGSHYDAEALWLPIKGLSWGMEKEKAISLLEERGVTLQQEKGTVPNRYVLSKMQVCWGFKGTVKLDFMGFSEEGDTYLTAFGFYPEGVEEGILLKELSKAFGVEGTNPPGIAAKGMQWESEGTLSDIPDKAVRKRAEDLIEKNWGNTPFHEATAEMSRPLVTAQYKPSEQTGLKSSLYLNGERAAVAAFAEEKRRLQIGSLNDGSSGN